MENLTVDNAKILINIIIKAHPCEGIGSLAKA